MKVSSAHGTTPETASEHSTTASSIRMTDFHTPTPPPSTIVDSSPRTGQSVPEHTTTEAPYTGPSSQPSSNQPTKDSSQPVISTDYPTDFILIDTSNGTVSNSTRGPNGNGPSNGTKARATSVIVTTTTSTTVAPTAPGGESVYRMILNRLSNLEGNQTLYARYVEDQARSANDRLRILEQEVGRLGALVSSFVPGCKFLN